MTKHDKSICSSFVIRKLVIQVGGQAAERMLAVVREDEY